jgi:hypothetical protein
MKSRKAALRGKTAWESRGGYDAKPSLSATGKVVP